MRSVPTAGFVFLAEGAYTSADRLQAQPQAITPAAFGEISASIPEAIRKYCGNIADGHAPAAHVARSVVEQWQLRLPDDGADTHTIRFRAPDGQSGKLDIYLENENGVWQKVPTTEIGSYLSFEASGQDRAACGAVHVPRLVGVDRAGRACGSAGAADHSSDP